MKTSQTLGSPVGICPRNARLGSCGECFICYWWQYLWGGRVGGLLIPLGNWAQLEEADPIVLVRNIACDPQTFVLPSSCYDVCSSITPLSYHTANTGNRMNNSSLCHLYVMDLVTRRRKVNRHRPIKEFAPL